MRLLLETICIKFGCKIEQHHKLLPQTQFTHKQQNKNWSKQWRNATMFKENTAKLTYSVYRLLCENADNFSDKLFWKFYQ